MPAHPDTDAIHAALATVHDPEIHRPITEIGMLKGIDVHDGGVVDVGVYLTVEGCPMRSTITAAAQLPSGACASCPIICSFLRGADDDGDDDRRKPKKGPACRVSCRLSHQPLLFFSVYSFYLFVGLVK